MGNVGARGEALLQVGEETYPILFTNRALAQAEKQVEKPMLQLLNALGENKLGISDTAQLLAIGMEFGRRDAKSGPKPITLDDAWRVMDTIGFINVVPVVLGAIAEVLSFSAETERPPE